MDREWCLSMLLALFGGTMLLGCGWWPVARARQISARGLERIAWSRVWLPLAPALTVAAALCGWALREPDPVPEKVPKSLILISLPFVLLIARAAIRATRSLLAVRGGLGIATVGLLRPRIAFSQDLAISLDEREVAAALEHERAHARHRDPLRIWLAQLATDLQWPWPQARERLQGWLLALELARDEETRAAGVDGADLASAIVVAARSLRGTSPPLGAALIGERCALKQRIARLLAPLPDAPGTTWADTWRSFLFLIPVPLIALALGAAFGERAIRVLL
jgi:hypothetical protein